MVTKSIINDCVNEIFNGLSSEDKLVICTHLASALDKNENNNLFVETIETKKGIKKGIKLGVKNKKDDSTKISFRTKIYNPDALIHCAIMIQNCNK